jgi:hypothetical protein
MTRFFLLIQIWTIRDNIRGRTEPAKILFEMGKKKGLKILERYYRLIILVFQREFGAAEIYGGKMLG